MGPMPWEREGVEPLVYTCASNTAAHLHGVLRSLIQVTYCMNGLCGYDIRTITNAVLQASFLKFIRCRAPMLALLGFLACPWSLSLVPP